MTYPNPDNGALPAHKGGVHEKTLLWLMAGLVFFFVAFHVSPLWNFDFIIWFAALMAVFGALGFINASLMVGYKKAFIFMGIAAVIGFSAEQVGIWTGLIFGPYHYTNLLNPKLIDVPWVIPFAWFAAVYFAHVITNLIVRATPVMKSAGLAQTAAMAVLTALVATGFDVAIDPTMSHPEVAAWVWEGMSPTEGYMGVPFKNFQGWVITAFLIDFLYRLISGRMTDKPISDRRRQASLYTIAIWVGLAFGYMLIGKPVATQLIAVFVMALPAFLALMNLYARAWNRQAIGG
jgi:putative membrane protein